VGGRVSTPHLNNKHKKRKIKNYKKAKRVNLATFQSRYTEKVLENCQRVFNAIPECKVHGSCIPHALKWIEKELKDWKTFKSWLLSQGEEENTPISLGGLMDELSIQAFFELIDANGVGDKWQRVQIDNVRAYFEECFGHTPPSFPQIEENQRKARNKVILEEGIEQQTPNITCPEIEIEELKQQRGEVFRYGNGIW
jgi:hypothetical protein